MTRRKAKCGVEPAPGKMGRPSPIGHAVPQYCVFVALIVLCGSCFWTSDWTSPSAMAQQPRRTNPRAKPPSSIDSPKFDYLPNRPFLHHADTYPAFGVSWSASRQVTGVQAVWPHTYVSWRVLAATAAGVHLSDDSGKTFKLLANTSQQKTGVIRSAEFPLNEPDTFYFASQTKGIWRTTDAGKTFEQIASKATGLADDSVQQVCLEGADPRLQTLVAVHGDACPGLSISDDGGKTWKVFYGDFFIRKVVPGPLAPAWTALLAAKKETPEKFNVYYCHVLGDTLHEATHDLPAFDGARSVIKSLPEVDTDPNRFWVGDTVYWLAAAAGLSRSSQVEARCGKYLLPPAATGKVGTWSSLGCTWGATADSQLLFAYESTKLGMVVTEDDGKTFASFHDGLFTGEYVKEGAHIRAAANGNVFYAAINNTLYIGQRFTGDLAISGVRVDPPVSTMPSDLYTVTARIEGDEKPLSVSVDLSRLEGSSRTLMSDDGLHGDGAAGEGAYRAKFRVSPRSLRVDDRDWRRPWPGAIPLTITAVSQDGKLSSAVAVLALYAKPESWLFWSPDWPREWKDHTGSVSAAAENLPDRKAVHLGVAGPAAGKPKPWYIALGTNYTSKSIVGYYAIAFMVKSDAKVGKEMNAQLRDSTPDNLPVTTPAVLIIKEGLVEGGGITDTWRRVVIPISRLLKDCPGRYHSGDTRSLVLSGAGDAAENLWIGEVTLVATPEELKPLSAGPK